MGSYVAFNLEEAVESKLTRFFMLEFKFNFV
jgi:hypothetical protein